jgi:hypothetical protein
VRTEACWAARPPRGHPTMKILYYNQWRECRWGLQSCLGRKALKTMVRRVNDCTHWHRKKRFDVIGLHSPAAYSLVNHLSMLNNTIAAVAIFIDIHYGRREDIWNMRLRPPRCEDARVALAVLRQARRVERHTSHSGICVRRITLVSASLVDKTVFVCVKISRDGDRLPDLVDPRRIGVLLGGDGLSVRIRVYVAVHVPPRSDADGPRPITRVVVPHDGLEKSIFEWNGRVFHRLNGARPGEAERRGGRLLRRVALRRLVGGVGLDDVIKDGLVKFFHGVWVSADDGCGEMTPRRDRNGQGQSFPKAGD